MKLPIDREQAVQVTVGLLRVVAAVMFVQVGGLKIFGWFGWMPEGAELTTLIMTAGILDMQ